MKQLLPLGLSLLATVGCIAPSVVAEEDRAVDLDAPDVAWSAASAEAIPGYFVSTWVGGPMAAVLRGVVYLFEADGSYAGSALLDGAPPHFEVVGGSWSFTPEGLVLDGGPAATVEVAEDGSLRLAGEEGTVVLRRQVER